MRGTGKSISVACMPPGSKREMGGWTASSMAKILCCVSAGLGVGGAFEEGLGMGAGGGGDSLAAAAFKAKGAGGVMGTPLGFILWLSQRY